MTTEAEDRRSERQSLTPEPDAPGLDTTVLQTVQRIADEVAAEHATDVDRHARFPTEAVSSLRTEGLLGAAVPRRDGGLGLGIRELAAATEILAKQCSSTGLIWAMQHSQVLAIAEHTSASPSWSALRRRIAEQGTLIASVASEEAIGGNFGVSDAVLETEVDTVRVVKKASATSYAPQADGYLVSCRRGPSAPAHDTVVLLALRDQCQLRDIGPWDAMGMRGTSTTPVTIEARVPADQVFPAPFGQILRRTMIPVAHTLWSACWIGIASAALQRAHEYLTTGHRSSPARITALDDAADQLDIARDRFACAVEELDQRLQHVPGSGVPIPMLRGELAAVRRHNELKIEVSTLCAAAALGALRVIGMPGYAENSPWTVARQVRDLLSAPLMVNNLRLADVNAELPARQERQ